MMTELGPIVELLERQIGMAAGTVGPRTIESAVRRRLDATGAKDVSAYLFRIRTDRQELVELVDTVVVPETWFFRYPESFKYLSNWALERRSTFTRSRPLRILSIPCCTGEEPYSAAMTLIDAGLPANIFKIDGVDVSQRLTEFATAGVYGSAAFRDCPEGIKARHFDCKNNSCWTIHPNIRQAVSYRVGNVADPNFLGGEQPYDAIFCRNLFIYLSDQAKKTAVNSMHRLLAPEGIIFMGHAEPLGLVDPRFKSTGPAQAFTFSRGVNPTGNSLGTPATSTLTMNPLSGNLGGAPASPPPPTGSVFPLQLSLPKSNNTTSASGALSGLPGASRLNPAADLLAQAKIAANAGNPTQAIALSEKYLTTNNASVEAYALIGVSYLMLNDTASAELNFTRALYLDPGHYESLIHMMALAEKRGDLNAAANFRRRAGGIGRLGGKR